MTTSIHRRSFLQTAAALGAATALSNTGQAVAGTFTGKINKAVKYHMITEKVSVMDKLKMAKDAGFDGIELNYDLENDLSPKSGTKEYTAIRKMADEIGMYLKHLS